MHIVIEKSIGCICSRLTSDIRCRLTRAIDQYPSMANYAKYGIIIAIITGMICGKAFSVLEDADRNVLGLSFPYGKELDSELQLAKLLLIAPRFYHSKRNSELINSLLGLPKNMHNAGK